jgi:tetratricopeptide (TPR) repeat protein
MPDPAVSVLTDPKIVARKAPEALPEEKKAVQASADLKKGLEKAVPPAGKVPEAPAEGEKAPEEPQEDLSDPKRILFDLELEDGTSREVTAADAAQAISLTDQAIAVLEENKKLKSEGESFKKSFITSPNPLVPLMRTLAAEKYDGDTAAAYEEMIQYIEQEHKAYEEFLALPPEEQVKIRLGRQLKIKEEKLRRINEKRDQEEKSASKAENLSKVKKILDSAVVEFHLPDTDEARFLLTKAIRKQRAAGRRTSLAEAAKTVQAIYDRRKEGFLKSIPKDELLKARPEVLEAYEAEKLAQVKKGRALDEAKAPPEPPPVHEHVSHRVPTSRM